MEYYTILDNKDRKVIAFTKRNAFIVKQKCKDQENNKTLFYSDYSDFSQHLLLLSLDNIENIWREYEITENSQFELMETILWICDHFSEYVEQFRTYIQTRFHEKGITAQI